MMIGLCIWRAHARVVDDATSDAEQRAAAGVLHHWTTDLLSLYSTALTLRSTESDMQLPHKVPPIALLMQVHAAYMHALDLCAQTAKQRPIASPPQQQQQVNTRSYLTARAAYSTRLCASRTRAERGTRLESWQ